MTAASSGPDNAAPRPPAIPVNVYSCCSSVLLVETREMIQEPRPPAATMMPNDGPRLAPVKSDIAEIANRLSTLDGSTQPART